jgi:hypothetical protein
MSHCQGDDALFRKKGLVIDFSHVHNALRTLVA